jgi:hypothetical protein
MDSQAWSTVLNTVLVFATSVSTCFSGLLVITTGIYVFFTSKQARAAESQLTFARETLKSERKAAELENDRDGFLRLLSTMEASRADRQFVRAYAKEDRKFSSLKQQEITHVDNVCRAFDILGFFDRRGLVNHHLVDEFYATPFVRLYEAYLKEYVDHIRQDDERGKTHFWELIRFYERVKNVPSNDPGLTGSSEWPEDARKGRAA